MTKQELGNLIISSKGMFYRISKTILHNDSDCEEAVSEMIVSAFAQIGQLRDERYARTWLTRVLINKCYDLLRRKKPMSPMRRNWIPERINCRITVICISASGS